MGFNKIDESPLDPDANDAIKAQMAKTAESFTAAQVNALTDKKTSAEQVTPPK